MRFALLLLAACGGKGEDPTCERGWDFVFGECVAALPDGDGLDSDGLPEALEDGELSLAEQEALAERFQPAMVFSGADIWPVEVQYCFESGADLYSYDPSDGDHEAGEVAVEGAALPTADLASLDPGLIYGVDCPGDIEGGGYEEATWITEWQRIQGDDPTASPYLPVHYVHLAWFEQAERQVLIQYWFWTPYDKFANNHEGDWEHVNLIVGVGGDEPELLDAHFFFHSGEARRFERLTRITDASGGDHVVVFAGGCGEIDGWGGCYSGASYPWPGLYEGTAEFIVEDVTSHARFLHPDDIGVVLLPEPEAVVAGGDVAISWLPLDIYHGQWTAANAPIVSFATDGSPPTQPAYKSGWNDSTREGSWVDEAKSEFAWFDPPEDWDVIYNPGHDDSVRPEGE